MDTLQFRAGLMHLQNGQLVADPRKGLVRIVEQDDGLPHLLWFERKGAEPVRTEPEIDALLVPFLARFEKVQRPGARIFVLHRDDMDDADKEMFFWLQEPATHDDDALLSTLSARLQSQLDEPMDDAPIDNTVQTSAPTETSVPEGSMSYREAAVSSGVPDSSAGRIGAAELASILSNLRGGTNEAAVAAQMLQRMQQEAAAGPSLSEVLKPEVTVPLAREHGMLERLAPFMPEEHRTPEQLQALLESPQFRRQLDVFTSALVSGQLDLRHLSLQPRGFGVAAFLEAIAEKEQQNLSSS